jgi:signal transduction histidine kinase
MGVVDLNEVVESVRSNLEVRLEEANADVTVASLPLVQGSQHRLEQLFQNLLTNAIKYTGETPPTIDIDVTTGDGQCEVTVSDNGIGLDQPEQESAFTIFYTNGSTDESTGIGLALCRKIVQTHGGTIWLDSTPGEGTTVHFTLSLEASEVEP